MHGPSTDTLLAGYEQAMKGGAATLFTETENGMFMLYGRIFWTIQARRLEATRKELTKRGGAALPARLADPEDPVDLTGVAMIDLLASCVTVDNTVATSGAFPSLYRWDRQTWETVHEGRYSAVDMGTTVYWLDMVRSAFPEVAAERPFHGNERLLTTEGYAAFLVGGQGGDGALPAFYASSMEPLTEEVLVTSEEPESGDALNNLRPTAVGGAVLALAARKKDSVADLAKRNPYSTAISHEVYHEAAVKAGDAVLAALYAYKGKGAEDLTLVWVAAFMLRLYVLTSDTVWLAAGDYALQLLNLYQQLWDPTRLAKAVPNTHFFGGYGASNAGPASAPWSVHPHLVIPALADFYTATRKLEYLERAVAAAHASYGRVDLRTGLAPAALLSKGAAAEATREAPPAGLSDGGLGAGTACAYLVKQFGHVMIDRKYRRVVAVDALAVSSTWLPDGSLTIDVQHLPAAAAPHHLVITFSTTPPAGFTLVVNAQPVTGIGGSQSYDVWVA